MTPATRAALGLSPLPPQQAARIQAQHRALCAGLGPRWPTGLPVVQTSLAHRARPSLEAARHEPR